MEPLVELIDLEKRYGDKLALPPTCLQIFPGETLGIVGKSGCGKSTLCRILMDLITPTSGHYHFRGERKAMVFQDPYASLNPKMRARQIVGEPFAISGTPGDPASYLQMVGLGNECLDKYPHEFSGGQRQRIGIARALACQPDFLVLDEPISALDVSIQAQVICLLESLREELGLTLLFVSHDPVMTNYFCNRIIHLEGLNAC